MSPHKLKKISIIITPVQRQETKATSINTLFTYLFPFSALVSHTKNLIMDEDENSNTPLHLAALGGHDQVRGRAGESHGQADHVKI
jgi:hypothetical protein